MAGPIAQEDLAHRVAHREPVARQGQAALGHKALEQVAVDQGAASVAPVSVQAEDSLVVQDQVVVEVAVRVLQVLLVRAARRASPESRSGPSARNLNREKHRA